MFEGYTALNHSEGSLKGSRTNLRSPLFNPGTPKLLVGDYWGLLYIWAYGLFWGGH